MVSTDSSVLPGIRPAGLALVVGVILSFGASILLPGGAVIDPVDQNDFAAVIGAWTDNAGLTHSVNLVFIFAMLLEAYGFLGLFRLLGQERSAGNSILLFGLVTSLFSWGVFVIGMGMRHIVIHIAQHSLGSGAGLETQAQADQVALTTFTAMAGVHFAFLAISPIATMLTGIGLASRFPDMSIYKLAPYGLMLSGLAGIINLIFTQHLHDVDLGLFAMISSGLLLFGALWLLIIGIGMLQGRYEFTGEDRYAW